MHPATEAFSAILAIMRNHSVDYSAEMNFANQPCLGIPNHIIRLYVRTYMLDGRGEERSTQSCYFQMGGKNKHRLGRLSSGLDGMGNRFM